MKEQLFLIRDVKSEDWGKILQARTIGEMVRIVEDEVNSENSMLAKHPEDYTLFHVGEYDRNEGQFKQLPQPISLGVLVNFKK